MKKLFVIVLSALLVIGVTACGKEETASTASTASTTSATSATSTTSTAVSEAGSTTSGTTIESFIASIQSQLDSMKDAMESAGMKMDVVARDDSLVYSYQYLTAIENVDTVKDTLASSLSAQDSTYETVLKSVKLTVPTAKSVIIEYKNADGSVIYSKEYK